MCFLWSAVEAQEWGLHSQFKGGVEYYFTTALEALIYAVHDTHM